MGGYPVYINFFYPIVKAEALFPLNLSISKLGSISSSWVDISIVCKKLCFFKEAQSGRGRRKNIENYPWRFRR